VLDGSPYRGALVVRRVYGGVSVVNDLGVDDYVRGVVAFEMPSRWAREALRAQAVAARSYVLAELRPDRAFDVYPDTRSQMYGGVRAERTATDAAVRATGGQVLAWRDGVATTYYSSSSGGRTAAVEDVWPGARPVPYLRSVADPYDSGPRWTFRVSRAELAADLGLHRIDSLREVRNRSGRLAWLDVRSGRANHRIAGRAAAAALGLRSSWFTIAGAKPRGDAGPFRRSMRIVPVPRAPAGETTAWSPIAGLGIALLGVLWIELVFGPRRRRARLVTGGLLIVALPTVPLGSIARGSGPQYAPPAMVMAQALTAPAVPADPPHPTAAPAPPVASPTPIEPQPAVRARQTAASLQVASVPEPVPPATGEPIPAIAAPVMQPVAQAAPPASTTTSSQSPVSPTPATPPPPPPPGPLEISDVKIIAVTPTATIVRWRTSSPSVGMGAVGGALSPTLFTSAEAAPSEDHETTFTGLQPDVSSHLWLRANDARNQSATVTVDVTTPAAPPSATPTVAGDAITLGGQPFFPFVVSAACAQEAQAKIAVGINLFLGNGCGDDGALAEALHGRAFTATDGHDENGPLAAGAVVLRGPPATPGLLSFLTLTEHFYSGAAPLPQGNGIYPTLAGLADLIGFGLYPQQGWCRDDAYGDVYDAQRELAQLSGGKPTFQWIEAGPMERCTGQAPDPDPASVRAETWLAIAGGAEAIGYDPPTWTDAVGAELARTNAQIRTLAPALLDGSIDAQAASPLVKVSARAHNGATYVIAVNTTRSPVDTTIAVPGLKATAVDVYDEQRQVSVAGGAFADHFDPLTVHIYVAAPATWTSGAPSPARVAARR
jgi:SpoIID/LytB domain protein